MRSNGDDSPLTRISSTSVCGTPSASIMCLTVARARRARQIPATLCRRQEVVQFLVETECGGDHAAEYDTNGHASDQVASWSARVTQT
jgi:hypothetical protein